MRFRLLDSYGDQVSYAVFPRTVNIDDQQEIQDILESRHPPIYFKNQLHGTDSFIVTSPTDQPLGGDILITKEKQIPLIIRVADCAGLLLFDQSKNVIANIHAGWKGISQRAITAAIKTLSRKFNSKPKDLIACISPMIGPCCCNFTNPKKELPKFMHRYISEENTVDLWAAVEGQLKEAGVPVKQIENPRICTSCNVETYYSYRREGPSTGRSGTVIMLK